MEQFENFISALEEAGFAVVRDSDSEGDFTLITFPNHSGSIILRDDEVAN